LNDQSCSPVSTHTAPPSLGIPRSGRARLQLRSLRDDSMDRTRRQHGPALEEQRRRGSSCLASLEPRRSCTVKFCATSLPASNSVDRQARPSPRSSGGFRSDNGERVSWALLLLRSTPLPHSPGALALLGPPPADPRIRGLEARVEVGPEPVLPRRPAPSRARTAPAAGENRPSGAPRVEKCVSCVTPAIESLSVR
jgi:hypothetical protein